MRTKIFLTIICLSLIATVQAQKKGLKFQSQVQVGLLEGEQGSALQLQTVQGVKYKTWSGGIGAGLDYYHTRTIPLFFDVRKTFNCKEKTGFVYASGGYNFPWPRVQDKIGFESDFKGGLYYDAGIGYQLPVLKTSALFFTAGYSVKKFSTTHASPAVPIFLYPGPPPSYYYYTLQRISIKTGLRF